MHFTKTEAHKARKAHRCSWCWQLINTAEIYKRYRAFDGGDASTIRMHPECHDAMTEAAKEEGGIIEWTPGMERPVIGITGKGNAS